MKITVIIEEETPGGFYSRADIRLPPESAKDRPMMEREIRIVGAAALTAWLEYDHKTGEYVRKPPRSAAK